MPEATIKDAGASGEDAAKAATDALNNLTATRLPELSQAGYETVDHPAHYGGAGDPFEAIKIIEAKDLTFHTGSALKYMLRAGRKPGTPYVEDLKKAVWYLQREIERCE